MNVQVHGAISIVMVVIVVMVVVVMVVVVVVVVIVVVTIRIIIISISIIRIISNRTIVIFVLHFPNKAKFTVYQFQQAI